MYRGIFKFTNMKMVLGTGTIADYASYIYNCTLGQYNYKIPVNSLQDVQLYIAIGASAPGSATYELIHTCGPTGGTVETLSTSAYVIGQDSNDNYYGVFKNFNETTTASCFVIAITLDGNIYFSQEYCIDNTCRTLNEVKGCYGNLEPQISYDREGIYFGQSQGGTQGDSAVVYEHKFLMREVELTLNAIKNTFKQGRTRNFRTESADILLFWGDLVPEWYIRHVDAVFKRGEVYIGTDGIKYLVENTAYEKADECFKNWKPSVTLIESQFQSFSCETDPCIVISESGSGGAAAECCDPTVTNATVEFTEGNNVTVNFTPCSPSPANGYIVFWRVAGSGTSYTNAGTFTSSPAIFTDGENSEGTQYEGYIYSDCGSGITGNFIPWSTGASSDYTITLQSPCNGILSSYQVAGGTPGDIVTVRASFSGQMTKIGQNFVRADIQISSPDGTSSGIISSACYADTAAHFFTIIADTIITMVGTTAIVNLNAVVNNSSESLTNVGVTIIDVNGTAKNISEVGCRGNSSTGGTC